MARIRSIHPELHTDEAFMSLSMAARVFLPGLWMHADDQGVFEWKPLTLKARILPADNVDASELLAEIELAGWTKSFESGGKRYGALRNFCRYQRPKEPKIYHPLPVELRSYVAPLPKYFPSAWEKSRQMEDGEGDGIGKDTPLPPKGGAERDEELPRSEKFPTPADLREATTHWNTLAAELGLPQVERLTDKRQKHLRARLQELEGLGPWFGVVNSIRDSPFLCGQKTDWRCDFDWFVNASNFQKVIEGKYAERGKSNASH